MDEPRSVAAGGTHGAGGCGQAGSLSLRGDTLPACRSYTTDDCEYDNDAAHEQLFETPEQIWEYAHAVMPPKPRRRPHDPVSLPVVSVG